MFSRADAFWVSETARILYSAKSVQTLADAALKALESKFALHSFALEEIGQNLSTYQCHLERCAVSAPADYIANLHDNPFAWVNGAERPPPVLHMREHVPRSQWERTDHFNAIARPMGWNDQMMIVARSTPTFVSVGLYRDIMFSERERYLVALLQPHLTAVWRRVQPPENLTDRITSPEIQLSPQLRPFQLDAGQRRVLLSYFPRWRDVGHLPEQLRAWVAHSIGRLRTDPLARPLHAFTAKSARGRLLVRCFPMADLKVLLRMVETPAVPNFFRLRARGVTQRECEVLHWVSHGKRDSEIAAVVDAAPGTIRKHVENVLRKLCVETRGAAVRAARAHIGSL